MLSACRGEAFSWWRRNVIIFRNYPCEFLGLVFCPVRSETYSRCLDHDSGAFHGIVLVKRVGVAVASVTDSVENEQ